MYIKSLRMINFQKHSDLTLDFTSGVNYLFGSSDAGKSCCRRAIGFVFFGEPRADSIRKEGTKTTSVTAVLDSGIEVERIKSSSINRYVVRQGGKELTYDSIGAGIPEDVQKVLQVITINVDDKEKPLNLNIAEQISLPFLLDKSGSYRLKLFNLLTGSDLLDKVTQNLNKEILSLGRDIKTTTEFIETNEPKLKEVTIQHTEKAKLLGNFKVLHERIKKDILTLQNLKSLNCSVKELNVDLHFTQKALEGVRIVPEGVITTLKGNIDTHLALKAYRASIDHLKLELEGVTDGLSSIKDVPAETIGKIKTAIGKYDILFTLQRNYDENKRNLDTITMGMASIKVSDLEFDSLREKIKKITALETLKKQVSQSFDSIQETILKINDTTGNVKILDQQYQDLLKEAGTCPLCKQSTCESHL